MHQRTMFLAASVVFALTLPLFAQDSTTLHQTVPVPVADLNPSNNLPLQRVGPEDLIGLSVYDAPEFTRTVRIAADGTIRLPMLKSTIKVDGLMPDEIEKLVADALQNEELLVDPFVVVNIVEYHSRPISVNGAVRTPTIFQAIGKVTVLDALARGGGLVTGQAGADIVVTIPNGETGTSTVRHIPVKPLMSGANPELNLILKGGEDVRVPDVGQIIVAGSVVHPGPVPILDGAANTVITAIAQAQGTIQYYSHVAYIYRPDTAGNMQEIRVELGKIQSRKKPDITLQAKDILYVPDSSGRRITQTTINSLTGVAAGATTAMIYVMR